MAIYVNDFLGMFRRWEKTMMKKCLKTLCLEPELFLWLAKFSQIIFKTVLVLKTIIIELK